MNPAETVEAAAPRSLIAGAALRLEHAGVDSAWLDAEVLLAEAACLTRERLWARFKQPLEEQAASAFAALVARRVRREPLAYLTGRREFYGLELEVCPDVLIARPETETLVDLALAQLKGRRQARVLDLGTGCGAIAMAIAVHTAGVRLVGADICSRALSVARRNVQRHGLSQRIALERCDIFTPQDGGPHLGRFDLVVSNPPYVTDDEYARLSPEVRCYEPRTALVAGADGLSFYRRIAAQLPGHLFQGGVALLEVDPRRAQAVGELMAAAGARSIGSHPDLAGQVRVVEARFY